MSRKARFTIGGHVDRDITNLIVYGQTSPSSTFIVKDQFGRHQFIPIWDYTRKFDCRGRSRTIFIAKGG